MSTTSHPRQSGDSVMDLSHPGQALAPELATRAMPAWRRRPLDDLGQATTEYALVLLAAAMVGLLVIGWATAGGGAAAIGGLFNRVISSVAGKL